MSGVDAKAVGQISRLAYLSARLEYHTIFERVPKWSSWGILVEWFDGKGYHAEWFERRTLGLDGAEEYEVR
jgi:hypothetical protein